mmetsp:Transcript_6708/g.25153  ORF Transcript_6708/g.25153 Transcript_6708/m.25153 type:complete len:319 (-) Transcript_6708:425-1381(-)
MIASLISGTGNTPGQSRKDGGAASITIEAATAATTASPSTTAPTTTCTGRTHGRQHGRGGAARATVEDARSPPAAHPRRPLSWRCPSSSRSRTRAPPGAAGWAASSSIALWDCLASGPKPRALGAVSKRVRAAPRPPSTAATASALSSGPMNATSGAATTSAAAARRRTDCSHSIVLTAPVPQAGHGASALGAASTNRRVAASKVRRSLRRRRPQARTASRPPRALSLASSRVAPKARVSSATMGSSTGGRAGAPRRRLGVATTVSLRSDESSRTRWCVPAGSRLAAAVLWVSRGSPSPSWLAWACACARCWAPPPRQ